MFSTCPGIVSLNGRCDGSCNHVDLRSRAPCGTKWGILARPTWPACADAVAAAFDRIMGTTLSPKCAHLAGLMASDAKSSV